MLFFFFKMVQLCAVAYTICRLMTLFLVCWAMMKNVANAKVTAVTERYAEFYFIALNILFPIFLFN